MVIHDLLEVTAKEQGLHYRLQESWFPDIDIGLSLVTQSAVNFDRSLLGTKAARLFHTIASVTPKALEEIHDILTKAIADIIRVKNDPTSSGTIPFFTDVMMNVLDPATVATSQEKNDEFH